MESTLQPTASKMKTGSAYYLPSPMTRAQDSDDGHADGRVKFIVVTGGVCSSLGKGITTSATGALLRAAGYHVVSIKIDPYINIDAGLMNPYEHGEVYVLEDGGETDLDLGNYERWMSVRLRRDHNITTGKIFHTLLSMERAGRFLGKTIQMVPHFTNAVVDHIFQVCQESVTADGVRPEVCLIELGGTIGDMESEGFVEALRRLRHTIAPQDFCLLHTTYLPVFGGTQKTKPTQHSCRTLLSLGLTPDFLVCRSEEPLRRDVREKLSNQCGVQLKDIISAPNVDCLYQIPIEFTDQGLIDRIIHKLRLRRGTALAPSSPSPSSSATALSTTLTAAGEVLPNYNTYKHFTSILHDPTNPVVRIAFVGKYVAGGNDTYFSVVQCFEHCQLALRIRLDVLYINSEDLVGDNAEAAKAELLRCDGVFVPGGFGGRGVDGKCAAVHLAREHNIPYFGVCLGMQVALIEFARNVLGYDDANSEEFDADSGHHIVRRMDVDKATMGANMHLGAREVHLVEPQSTMRTIYSNADVIIERHRHRYEVNATYLDALRAHGMRISAVADPDKGDNMRVEAIELPAHRFFLAVQYHPEFMSAPLDPSPPYLAFFAAAARKAYKWPEQCTPRRLPQPQHRSNDNKPQ